MTVPASKLIDGFPKNVNNILFLLQIDIGLLSNLAY
jgi:hypothetical protein